MSVAIVHNHIHVYVCVPSLCSCLCCAQGMAPSLSPSTWLADSVQTTEPSDIFPKIQVNLSLI